MKDIFQMKCSTGIQAAEPLYKRLPGRGSKGQRLNDLLIIFPGLKAMPVHLQQKLLQKIEKALMPYEKVIVIAEVNIKLSTLWLSIEPHYGLGAEIAAWIHDHIPESRLVAQHSVIDSTR